MSIGTAFRAFFASLLNREKANAIRAALAGQALPAIAAAEKEEAATPRRTARPSPAEPSKPAQPQAVTLLATLQREARLIDFVMEPIDEYSDAQVGAAVRDIHRDLRKTLDRLFSIESVVGREEGETVEVPAGFDAGEYHLTGSVSGEPPFSGELMHAGWKATKAELPTYTGSKRAVNVVAPVEVEVR